jgi:hypothetical protein
MHFFVAEMAQQNPATFQILMARAQGIYRENLDSYIRLVLRKPLAKIIVRLPSSYLCLPTR